MSNFKDTYDELKASSPLQFPQAVRVACDLNASAVHEELGVKKKYAWKVCGAGEEILGLYEAYNLSAAKVVYANEWPAPDLGPQGNFSVTWALGAMLLSADLLPVGHPAAAEQGQPTVAAAVVLVAVGLVIGAALCGAAFWCGGRRCSTPRNPYRQLGVVDDGDLVGL